MVNIHLSPISGNRKTGPIPVSTTGQQSCPTTCKLRGSGCYAELGHTFLHWKKVTNHERGSEHKEFFRAIAKLPNRQTWRHNQAGDLIHTDGQIDSDFIDGLVKANRHKRGFTYTHHVMNEHNLNQIRKANKGGFAVNISLDSIHEIAAKKAHGLPMVVILEHDAPNVQEVDGVKVVACPAEKTDKIQCSNCASTMCANPDRNFVIGFRVHGSRKAKANIIAKG